MRTSVREERKSNRIHSAIHACTTCSLVICCPVARSTFGLLFSDCATIVPEADADAVVAAAAAAVAVVDVTDCVDGDDCWLLTFRIARLAT